MRKVYAERTTGIDAHVHFLVYNPREHVWVTEELGALKGSRLRTASNTSRTSPIRLSGCASRLAFKNEGVGGHEAGSSRAARSLGRQPRDVDCRAFDRRRRSPAQDPARHSQPGRTLEAIVRLGQRAQDRYRGLSATGGKSTIVVGPFAETKEQIGGYYVIECKDRDEAV